MVDDQDFTHIDADNNTARSDKKSIIVCGMGEISKVYNTIVETGSDMSSFIILVDGTRTNSSQRDEELLKRAVDDNVQLLCEVEKLKSLEEFDLELINMKDSWNPEKSIGKSCDGFPPQLHRIKSLSSNNIGAKNYKKRIK